MGWLPSDKTEKVHEAIGNKLAETSLVLLLGLVILVVNTLYGGIIGAKETFNDTVLDIEGALKWIWESKKII